MILRTTEDPSQMIQFSLKRISTIGPKCGGPVRLSQTRPIPRSHDGDNNKLGNQAFFMSPTLRLPSQYHIATATPQLFTHHNLARLRKTTSCEICIMHFELQDSSAVDEKLAELTPISSFRQRSLNSRDASRSSNLCQSALPIYIFSHSQGHLLTEYSANNNLQLQEFE